MLLRFKILIILYRFKNINNFSLKMFTFIILYNDENLIFLLNFKFYHLI
jgi:hypothetical protein